MIFNIYGHKNTLSTHKNTIEFTKDYDLTEKGDCILGVKAGFDYSELKKIVNKYSKIQIKISVDGLSETINCEINKDFDDMHEIVIRRTDFISKRTLGIRADKAAKDINRRIVEILKEKDKKAKVEIIGLI